MSLKELRLAQNMTQSELAAKIGVKRNTIAMWETGKRTPAKKKLMVIAKILECNIEQLLQSQA